MRGLKFICPLNQTPKELSHPAWGAWIEISTRNAIVNLYTSRTPHGVRGLKSIPTGNKTAILSSHPAWGAWIEIVPVDHISYKNHVAPRMGCVD